MKVLLINNRPPYCGIGRYTFSLYSALRKLQGDEVELLNWESKFVERLYLKVRNSQLLQYPEEALRIFSQFIFILRIPREYDLYHVTNSSLAIVVMRTRPCVVTVHDLVAFASPRDNTDRLIQRSMRALKRADRIICVSQNTKQDLLRFLDLDSNLVRVIHEGIDHSLYKPRNKVASRQALGLAQDKLIVLHVGNEEERKNIPTLIKAFHKLQLQVPNAILVRIGERTKKPQQLIKSLELSNRVLYFSNVEDLSLFYNAADLFLFPSYQEGFGLPPLEAMASGCAVIASNAAAIPEVVGDAGILVDPFDTDGFAYWMQKAYTDQELRANLIVAGIKQSQRFSWERNAKETLEVYAEILGHSA